MRRPRAATAVHREKIKNDEIDKAAAERIKLVITAHIILAGAYNTSWAEWGMPVPTNCVPSVILDFPKQDDGSQAACATPESAVLYANGSVAIPFGGNHTTRYGTTAL